MKTSLTSLLMLFWLNINAQDLVITGKVAQDAGCSPKTMVWLALDRENFQEKLLLLHTQVPSGGTYQFFVKPGNYLLSASDESGCEFHQKIEIPATREKNIYKHNIVWKSEPWGKK